MPSSRRHPSLAKPARTILFLLSRARGWQLFVLAFVLRCAAIRWMSPYEITENLRAGFTLANAGYFGDPFILPTGPTAHIAPAYPFLVSLIRRVVGSDPAAVAILRVIAAAVGSLNILLLLYLAKALGFRKTDGRAAALFWLLPVFTWAELSAEHETVFATAALLLVLIVEATRWLKGEWDARAGVQTGLVTGVAMHFTPLALTASIGSTLAAARVARVPLRKVFATALPALAAVALAIMPYTIRNIRTMHAVIIIRDNLGLELDVSNNDRARPAAIQNLAAGAGMTGHPFSDVVAAREVREVGEVAFNRARLKRALEWMWTHPKRLIALTAERTYLLVVPYSVRWYQRALPALVVLLAVVGLLGSWRTERRMGAAMVAGAAVGYEFVYVLIQNDVRYVFAPLFCVSVLAGVALTDMLEHVAARHASGEVGEPASAMQTRATLPDPGPVAPTVRGSPRS